MKLQNFHINLKILSFEKTLRANAIEKLSIFADQLGAMITLILIGLVFLCVLCWCWSERCYLYWHFQNVPYVTTPFSYFYGNIVKSTHVALQYGHLIKAHRSENQSILGIYTLLLKPTLLIYDLGLIRQVLVKDFNHFQDRGMFYNERDDPPSAILGTLDHDKWKAIRPKLTPAFSPAKIRGMFPIMKTIGDRLIDGLKHIAKYENQVEIRDIIGRLTLDVIGTVAIGIDCKCLGASNTQILEMLQKAMKSHSSFLSSLFTSSFPKLARSLRHRKHPKEVSDFFIDIVKQTIKHRQENEAERNDYMQLLIDSGLTPNQIAAITFDFLSAGYSDTTNTLVYCLFELSLPENEEIQTKARKEIESVLQQRDGELAPNTLDKMNYIKLIINGKLCEFRLTLA